ncbi:UPF0691 protein C9orf116 [Harpegnathos saltator]|uniref:UPF0691 protein C9orf116 n=1 Tax=Harpegnathos saltator TaxID=610380 RepID=UPI00058D669C|nr:UPF0691 protein C9orf116 [Harpegnathos saltator]
MVDDAPCYRSDEKPRDYRDEKLSALGPRTDDVYRTYNLPSRFIYPSLFKGYGQESGPPPHPCYWKTSTDYGWYAPTIHTVPTTFYPRSTSFSSEYGRAGMSRNCSLNTELDKSLF